MGAVHLSGAVAIATASLAALLLGWRQFLPFLNSEMSVYTSVSTLTLTSMSGSSILHFAIVKKGNSSKKWSKDDESVETSKRGITLELTTEILLLQIR